jgi:Mrp family chromosome partitioning ATPase
MTEMPTDPVAPTLMRRTLRSRWRTVALITVAVTLLSAAYAVTKGPTYTSTAEVLVDALPGNAFSPASLTSAQQVTVGLTTEANLLHSSQVAALADAPGSGSVSASVVLNSQMIRISYSSASLTDAQQGAQAYAEALLRYRESVAETVRDNDISDLQDQMDVANRSLEEVDAQLARPNPPTGAAAKAQLITLQVADLQQSLADARAQPTHPGSVVVPASAPSKSQLARSILVVLAGLVLGLMAGLVVGAWRTWTDDRLDSRFVTAVGAKPIWATLHSLRYRHGDMSAYVERVAEEYRQLRAALMTNAPAPRVVLLAATAESEDISEVSVNLADSVASAGFQVTVVDASPRATLTRLLGFEKADGLADVLRGDCRLEDALDVTELLWLLPAGSNPSLAEDLTAGRRFADVVSEMRDGADYVFLVGPPVDTSVGLASAAIADTVLVVGIDGRTTAEEVERQLAHLAAHQLQIDGVVLTAPGPKSRPEPPVAPPRPSTPVTEAVEDADDEDVDEPERAVHDDPTEDDPRFVEVGDNHRNLRLASRSDVGKSA